MKVRKSLLRFVTPAKAGVQKLICKQIGCCSNHETFNKIRPVSAPVTRESLPDHPYFFTSSNPLYPRLNPNSFNGPTYALAWAGFPLIISTRMIFSGLNSRVSSTLKKAR